MRWLLPISKVGKTTVLMGAPLLMSKLDSIVQLLLIRVSALRSNPFLTWCSFCWLSS